jgi:hypothetical protein
MLTDAHKDALGIALNEATLLGVEVDPAACEAGVTVSVLSLPEGGGSPSADARVQFVLTGVGRVAASYLSGPSHDPNSQAILLRLGDLLPTVQSFGGLPVYGWAFFDKAEAELQGWGNRISLDWSGSCGGTTHSLLLFQEGYNRHLDVLIWFEALEIRDPEGQLVGIEEFVAGGKRWWNAFRNGDPRTQNSGMYPL